MLVFFINSNWFIEGLQKSIPDVYQLDGYFKYVAYGFAVRKDWRWATAVKEKFIQFGKNGYLCDVQERYEPKKPQSVNQNRPIDIEGYFELLIIMVAVGVTSSLYNVFYFLRWRWMNRRQLKSLRENSI